MKFLLMPMPLMNEWKNYKRSTLFFSAEPLEPPPSLFVVIVASLLWNCALRNFIVACIQIRKKEAKKTNRTFTPLASKYTYHILYASHPTFAWFIPNAVILWQRQRQCWTIFECGGSMLYLYGCFLGADLHEVIISLLHCCRCFETYSVCTTTHRILVSYKLSACCSSNIVV